MRTHGVDVLAAEFFDELVESLIISIDADGAEDLLDVLGGGRGVAADLEEEVSSDVAHFDLVCSF